MKEKIMFVNKGFKKRTAGGRAYTEVAPTLNATDYKQPPLIIEFL